MRFSNPLITLGLGLSGISFSFPILGQRDPKIFILFCCYQKSQLIVQMIRAKLVEGLLVKFVYNLVMFKSSNYKLNKELVIG